MDRRLLDYMPQVAIAPSAAPSAPELDEEMEMALGAELLGVSGAAGLEAFLADLVGRVGAAGANVLGTPLGRSLVDALGRAAQPVFPVHPAGGGPVIEALGGADLKGRAARIFGLELEGLSPEDKEFELARHFIRFASAAIGAATRPARGADPVTQVQAALLQAARRHAPGLLPHAARRPARAGRWQRQGKRIIVLDC